VVSAVSAFRTLRLAAASVGGILAVPHEICCHARAGDLPGQSVGAVGGAAQADKVVARHRQHVAHPRAAGTARRPGLAP
jgi:hypothetical protein